MILRTWNTFIFPLIFKSSSRQEETFSVLTFHAITLPSSTFFPLQKSKSGKKGSSFFMQKRGRGTPSFNFLNKKNTRKFQIKSVQNQFIDVIHTFLTGWVECKKCTKSSEVTFSWHECLQHLPVSFTASRWTGTHNLRAREETSQHLY